MSSPSVSLIILKISYNSSNLHLWCTSTHHFYIIYARTSVIQGWESSTSTRNTTFGTSRTSDGNHHGCSGAEIYGFCLVPSFLAGLRFDLRSNRSAISETRQRRRWRAKDGASIEKAKRERGVASAARWLTCDHFSRFTRFDLTISSYSVFSQRSRGTARRFFAAIRHAVEMRRVVSPASIQP